MSSIYKKYSDLAPVEQNIDESNIIVIKNLEHKNSLINNNMVLVVDVFSKTCGPCKMLAPKFATLANTYSKTGIIFAKEDSAYQLSPDVRGVPTIQYYFKGRLVNTTVGADIEAIKTNVEQFLR